MKKIVFQYVLLFLKSFMHLLCLLFLLVLLLQRLYPWLNKSSQGWLKAKGGCARWTCTWFRIELWELCWCSLNTDNLTLAASLPCPWWWIREVRSVCQHSRRSSIVCLTLLRLEGLIRCSCQNLGSRSSRWWFVHRVSVQEHWSHCCWSLQTYRCSCQQEKAKAH